MDHMADHVEVNYEQMQSVRNSFEQQSQDIQNMLKKIESQIDHLRGGEWIGQGANSFYDEMDSELLPAVQRLQQALQEGSQVIGQLVETFKQAEEESRSVWQPF
jgi:WXG100 family type VII secretion target